MVADSALGYNRCTLWCRRYQPIDRSALGKPYCLAAHLSARAAHRIVVKTMHTEQQTCLHRNWTWRAYRRVPDFILPRVWHDWVLDRGSLTRRLQQLAGGDFKVEVLLQGWQRPTRDECHVLSMPVGQQALVREVALHSRGEVVVKARSVIPHTTLTGDERQLRHLGSRPLGAYLFRARSMRRSAIELGAMQWHQQDWIYGRRSVFLLHDKPLLVSELFLPALLLQANSQHHTATQSE